jgi:aminocarboxymuconate-semialdehyde decarboxylase
MRIDVHNHAIPEPVLDLLRKEEAYGVRIEGDQWSGGSHAGFPLLPSFTDPAAKIAELESKGMDAAVVSAAPPLFLYDVEPDAGEALARETNLGLARFCQYAPTRLRWMAHVPMRSPERAAMMLDEATESGCVGVEIGTSIAGRRLDEPDFEPFWRVAEMLGLPVMLHPAYNEPSNGLQPYYLQNVIGNMLETTIAIERLICAGVLDRHPHLRILLAHSGGYFPYQAGRLKHARTVRPELEDAPTDPWSYIDRLYFDTITHDGEALRYLVSRVGPARVVLGSDLPFDMATPEPMTALHEAVDETTARQIAESNPAHLYRFFES